MDFFQAGDACSEEDLSLQPSNPRFVNAMNGQETFEKICRAMSLPGFYPHAVTRLEKRETHISAVFLTGDWVYKLKKPVNFGFLDFESLEARRTYCHREVLLNQRLTSQVYEGVVEIVQDAGGEIRLGGQGRVLDHVVKMRQLSEESNLEVLLKKGVIQESHMQDLGERLGQFYASSSGGEEISRFGDPHVISMNMEENFDQVHPFVGDLVNDERWQFIREVSRAFFRNHENAFKERVRSGCVVDGHGDLRAEHVYLEDVIQVIDCIEFNDRFRYGDVASDISFLYMDLDRLGHMDLGFVLLKAIVRSSGDHGLYGFIDFYAAYRAVVKLKVACFSFAGSRTDEQRSLQRDAAGHYLQQANTYALGFGRPTLWVFCGLPASGKSTLAEKLSQTLHVPLIQSDRVRKEAAGMSAQDSEVVPFGKGLYRSSFRHRVYGRMLLMAQESLERGRSVILDGTFSHRKWRDDARQLAGDLDTNMIFIECRASVERIRQRLMERETHTGASDARLQHLDALAAEYEPLRDTDAAMLITVSTEKPLDESFLEVVAESHARKCRQISKLPSVSPVS